MLPPSLPSDVSQKRLAKALQKVGFILDPSGGKGGHYKLTDPKSGKFITRQSHLWKIVLKKNSSRPKNPDMTQTKL